MKNKIEKYAEVRCDYLDETNMFWSVDAWKTGDDNEAGQTVAYIDDITGRVLYTDPDARTSELVHEVIADKLKEIEPVIECKRGRESISAKLKTEYGSLIAEIEPSTMMGTDYSAIYIGFEPAGRLNEYVDLQCARIDQGGLHLYMWNDISDDDWLQDAVITKAQIEEFLRNSLPSQYTFSRGELNLTNDSSEEEIADAVSDAITDRSGFCHKGFSLKIDGDEITAANIEWDTSE